MTRIVAGHAGGRRLAVPPRGTRPTSDRAREGLFSSLESRLGGLAGLRVLDLYAGSGAVGLEAWSRGATSVVLVEAAPPALKVLRANVAALSSGPSDSSGSPAPGGLEVIAGKAERVCAEFGGPAFDVVFADPPYSTPAGELAGVLQVLRDRHLLAPDAVLAVERASRDGWIWPPGFEASRERAYGDATLYYARYHARPARDIHGVRPL